MNDNPYDASHVVSLPSRTGQEADPQTKLANQLVELINKGDYAGKQTQ